MVNVVDGETDQQKNRCVYPFCRRVPGVHHHHHHHLCRHCVVVVVVVIVVAVVVVIVVVVVGVVVRCDPTTTWRIARSAMPSTSTARIHRCCPSPCCCCVLDRRLPSRCAPVPHRKDCPTAHLRFTVLEGALLCAQRSGCPLGRPCARPAHSRVRRCRVVAHRQSRQARPLWRNGRRRHQSGCPCDAHWRAIDAHARTTRSTRVPILP
jgi:hypothetical protein